MSPNPAAVLSQLIEFGYSPEPDFLPFQWRVAYEAVKVVHGSREDRLAAFTAAIEQFPDSFAMSSQVYAAAPVRENRGSRNRVLRDAGDALGPPPLLEWLVEGLLLRPSLNVLVGDPGAKKSLLAIDLAVSLALGQPWLGRKVMPCPVIFIDEEAGLIRLHNLLNGSLRAHQGTPQDPLHYLSLPEYNFRESQDCLDLLDKVESKKAGLIVIDALANTLRGGDENSSLSVAPVLNNLRRIAEIARCAILLVHHNNKEGIFRGSSVISASVDLMLSIESPPGDELIQLHPLKSRIVSPQPFAARAVFDDPLFWLEKSDEHISRKLGRAEAAVLGYLAANDKATTPQMMQDISTSTPGGVRQLIHQLKVSGLIERVNEGSHGQTAVFQLSESGRHYINFE